MLLIHIQNKYPRNESHVISYATCVQHHISHGNSPTDVTASHQALYPIHII